VVFLRVTVPDQDRQEIGDFWIGGVEMLYAAHNIGFTQAAIADGERKKSVRMKQRRRHREVLTLPERPGGRRQAWDRPGQVSKQPARFTKAFAHVPHCVNSHLFQGSVQEHRAIEPRRMMARLGQNMGVAKHHHGCVDVGRAGEPARVAGGFSSGYLQRQVTQCIGRN